MKIVYVFDVIAEISGIGRVFVDKMNYLANEYKQDVYFITACQGNHKMTYPLSEKVKHIDLSVSIHSKYKYSLLKRIYKGWKLKKKLARKLDITINEINPDIIISTTNYAADIICKLNCRAQKIIESHGAKIYSGANDGIKRNFILQECKKWEYKKYYKTIKKYATIVTLTKGDADDWKSNKTVVIPNIVQMHNTTHSTLKNKTVLFAGRFAQEKGLEQMLKAWKIVVNTKKDWTLRLVGDGDLKTQLIKQCEELGIEKKVTFINTTKSIVNEYLNSSIFLLTSIHEGLPLVLIEAMQCGVPCISFDCPYGPSDIIDNGVNGYLIENGNIEAFANAVLKLINDDELRKNMSKAAIEKSKQYLPGNIMPRWMDLFKRLTINDNNSIYTK